jgi:calcium binding protein 39
MEKFSYNLIIVHHASQSQLFAANKNKPAEVVNILVTNRSKLLRFFAGFKIDKGTIPALTFACLLA